MQIQGKKKTQGDGIQDRQVERGGGINEENAEYIQKQGPE